MEKYMSLSNFGYHLFIEEFEASDVVPVEGTNELTGILSVDIGGISKDTRTYKTLDGEGFDSIVSLGQSQEEISINLLRVGTGGIYTGELSETYSSYEYMKNWMDESTAQGGVNSIRTVVEVIPRGEEVYEGVAYHCIPVSLKKGTVNSEDGQTYTMTLKPFGKALPVNVTYTGGKFTFEKFTSEETEA